MRLQAYRARLHELLAPRRGEAILDLGCGTGEDLKLLLGSRSGLQAVGMDRSESALRLARRKLSHHIRSRRVELVAGDLRAGELPFPARSFDAVLSVDLVECLSPSEQQGLLSEIRRVLRPGGRVVLGHTDWDTQIWNASDRTLERTLVHAFCDWTQGWMDTSDGWMGRKLPGLIRRSKRFQGIATHAIVRIEERFQQGTFGHARAQDLLTLARKTRAVRTSEVRRFLRDLAMQDREGAYFYSVTEFVVSARRR